MTPSPASPIASPQQEISNIVALAREALKLNTRDFAAELGVSHAMVSLLERGENEPSEAKLVEWFNSDKDWLYRMAAEIFVTRYRKTLTQHRPIETPRNGKKSKA